MSARALMVAAPRSGAGKTTLTLGLLAAWRARGLRVRAAKSGPDYIDPAFHAAASGAPGVNLDSWAMPGAMLDALAAEAASGDLLVVESAMGLFDGVDARPGRTGAAADLAARFALPVLLVLDISGQAQSAAAVARGFAAHRPDVRIAGIVLNRVASARHHAMAAGAIADLGIPLLGGLPREPEIALPERHLGLIQAEELPRLRTLLDRLGEFVARHVDLDAARALATPLRLAPGEAVPAWLPPPGQRIGLARDAAFSFVYPHVLAAWRRAGAEIATFSPLADQPPPDDCDVCWLPGGYPELHAGRLAAATAFRDGLARFAQTRPVHGECGGHMVLGRGLQAADGTWHEMTGLLGHTTSFATRRMNLGYREAVLLADAPIGRAGAVLRGHEFHYATIAEPGGGAPLVELTGGQGQSLGPAGERRGHVSGTFFHAIATVGD